MWICVYHKNGEYEVEQLKRMRAPIFGMFISITLASIILAFGAMGVTRVGVGAGVGVELTLLLASFLCIVESKGVALFQNRPDAANPGSGSKVSRAQIKMNTPRLKAKKAEDEIS